MLIAGLGCGFLFRGLGPNRAPKPHNRQPRWIETAIYSNPSTVIVDDMDLYTWTKNVAIVAEGRVIDRKVPYIAATKPRPTSSCSHLAFKNDGQSKIYSRSKVHLEASLL